MSKLGSFDYSEVKNMAKGFQKALDKKVIEEWIRDFLLEMAFRAEKEIKNRTPVGVYPNKTGGHLRENWHIGNVEKQGNAYVVEIFNNTEYASYVEYGHRTRNHKSWVEGRFMAKVSMEKIEKELPKFMEKKQVELLNQILNGR